LGRCVPSNSVLVSHEDLFLVHNGGGDVFVHISAVEEASLRTLNAGQMVDYELEPGRKAASWLP
jgi:cold-shock-like DNA binding protein